MISSALDLAAPRQPEGDGAVVRCTACPHLLDALPQGHPGRQGSPAGARATRRRCGAYASVLRHPVLRRGRAGGGGGRALAGWSPLPPLLKLPQAPRPPGSRYSASRASRLSYLKGRFLRQRRLRAGQQGARD